MLFGDSPFNMHVILFLKMRIVMDDKTYFLEDED